MDFRAALARIACPTLVMVGESDPINPMAFSETIVASLPTPMNWCESPIPSAMPTVLRVAGFRFHFYSDEGSEPPHIHVDAGDAECKFWLSPVALAKNRGMSPVDIRKVERLVYEHQMLLLEKYDDFQSP